MGYKTGVDKKEQLLFPASLDEYVAEDNICRLIWAFTKQLDMEVLGFKYAHCKDTGCRPYDPRMMLNLYIYGYLHRVRSSRRLEEEAKRNIEVMWLMDGLKPDDRTISGFRKDNGKALKEAFRSFSTVCNKYGLYGGVMTATDSMKIRANNSLSNSHNATTVGNALTKIDKKIGEYLEMLEQGDLEEEGLERCGREKIKAALEELKERKEKYKGLKERLESESEVSTVDPDARLMRTGGEGRRLDSNYNVHTVVDSKYHLIVDFEVTNCACDAGNLKEMSDKAKEILEVESLVNLADSGYYDSADIAACEESGVTCLVAKGADGGPKKEEGYNRKDFVYDREKDVYKCPCQQELSYKGNRRQHISGRKYLVYSNIEACRGCANREKCTSAKLGYREYLRLSCQDVLDRVDERTRKNKALYRKRQEIVEHVFGTIKSVWGYRQYLCRTKPKVTAETALSFMAYNIRRVYNVLSEERRRMGAGMRLLSES